MANLLISVYQFEREIMLERQQIGIARARQEKRYKGRKPTAMLQAGRVKALKEAGLSVPEIMAETGLARASVYRALAAWMTQSK